MNIIGNFLQSGPDHLAWTEILKIDQDYFPRPWSFKDWKSLDYTCHHLLAWKLEKEIVGFALFGFIPSDDTAHLLKICMLPGRRSQGVAQEFWSEIVKWLKDKGIQKVYLEVEETNARAVGFYRKAGFLELRKVKGYYSDGVNGLMMLLTL